MNRIITMVMMSIVIVLNVNIAIPVLAVVDNTKYITKIVTKNDKNQLVFETKLTEVARKMSADAYGVEKDTTLNITKSERRIITYW